MKSVGLFHIIRSLLIGGTQTPSNSNPFKSQLSRPLRIKKKKKRKKPSTCSTGQPNPPQLSDPKIWVKFELHLVLIWCEFQSKLSLSLPLQLRGITFRVFLNSHSKFSFFKLKEKISFPFQFQFSRRYFLSLEYKNCF